MTPGPARIVCVGGATLDRAYRLQAPLVPGSSNPVAGRRGFGGVARNVAENFARLGVPTALVSCVGDDEPGRALVAALAALDVDTRGIDRVPGARTAEYAAVLIPEGELAFGLADMAVLDGLVPDALAAHAGLFREADWVFADCNLPAASLAWLAGRAMGEARYRLAVDAVSVAKAARLPQRLDGIALLFLNRDEAAALIGRPGFGEAGASATAPREGERPGASPRLQPVISAAEIAEALRAAGAAAVVLTLGAEGALAASDDGAILVPATPARIVDVTGAGDSLIAATLRALSTGPTLADAVAIGCRAAAHTLGRPEAVSPDLPTALRQPSAAPSPRLVLPAARRDAVPISPPSPAINQMEP